MTISEHIQVQVKCDRTSPGDCVAVVGSGSGLGDWNSQSAVRLDGSNFPIWKGTLQLPPGENVEYKYVIVEGSGAVQWEGFDGNRRRLVEPACPWHDGEFGKNPAKPSSQTFQAPVPSQNAQVSGDEISLTVTCSDTSPGEVVAVAGSWDWNATPLPMDGSQFPVWHRAIWAASNVEYKYVLMDNGGSVRWEPREGNRSARPGAVINDGDLRLRKPKEKDHGKGYSKTVHSCGSQSSIITGAKSTIYGKVCLDYGTLEQRMAKRMDQPEALQGDHDRALNDHGRKAPRAHLEQDLGALECAIACRAEALPKQHEPCAPPQSSIDEDSATALADIVAFESRSAVTLMDRFNMAADLLQRATPGGPLPWTIWVWLRFSQSRQLTWQRRSNTRPAHLSKAARVLSELIARRWVENPKERLLWRLLLGVVPRGSSGDDGQAIRDEILVIMQRHQLKKRKGDFMEQWHQKLHNNTTPDDIYICEAYLAFLRSDGDLSAFYGHLEHHNITRERLQTFERPILQEPVFFPTIKNSLINDFMNYLEILKKVHAGADLETCVDASSPHLDETTRKLLETILDERFVQGTRIVAVMGAVAAVRAAIPEPNQGNARDLLYLDLALEAHSRLLAERLGLKVDLRHAALASALLIESLLKSRLAPEVQACLQDFVGCLGKDDVGGCAALQASALAERARLSVAADSKLYCALQPRAERLGSALRSVTPEQHPEEWATLLFSEEAARGGPGFAASLMLTTYEKRLREVAGGTPWQIVSRTNPGVGAVHVMPCMKGSMQLPAPSVVLTDVLGGEEDPPEGTVAVLTRSAVDVLSHVAVRARTMGVFLATCFEPELFAAAQKYEGKVVRVTARADAVTIEELAITDSSEGATPAAAAAALRPKKVVISRPPPSLELWLDEQAIEAGNATGAKSRNLVALRSKLPDWIKQPSSAVVPYGVMARVLEASENTQVANCCKDLASKLAVKPPSPESLLLEMRDAIRSLRLPESMGPALQKAVEMHGGKREDQNWWQALKAVWASSWNDRAFHACSRAGIQNEDVAMSVLVQQLVPAEYSFVLHTVHPTGDPSDLYGEVVVGLGEVLVGNYEGRGLAFVAPRDGSKAPCVSTLPSKQLALSSMGLIFRSDSNAEDLEDFAGAGLFDSVPVKETSERIVEYRREKLVQDQAFQKKLLHGLSKLAMAVEAAAGGLPQDIEGCYADGQFFVVQTRPQA